MFAARSGPQAGLLRLLRFGAFASLLLAALAGAAPPAARPLLPDKADLAIPEPLRPWVGWVLHDKQQALCPFLHGDGEPSGRHCSWPAELTLTLGDRGGRFSQRFRVYDRSWVPLPGDQKVWPQAVLVDGKPAVVAAPAAEEGDSDSDSQQPQVLLLPGDHVVSGAFAWEEMPESLKVPAETGLLSLSVRGQKLPLPSRDAEGRLWLQKAASEKEEEVLELTVARKVTDEVPLLLTTRIELRVSGKSREVVLGKTLPPGFIPLSMDAPLPAKLESDSHLRVQVRAGTWVLTLVARHDGPVKQLRRPAPAGPWPDAEVWVFQSRPSLRVVTVDGVPLLDPQQTTLPADWKQLPCYPMQLSDTLTLQEQRRGDAEPAADQLTLRRQLWLDFDGGGYTVRDSISGQLNRASRLEVNPPMALGRVAVSGEDQFITRTSGSSRSGVEVRQARLQLSADSRVIPSQRGLLPAVGWDADFHQVQPVTLHMPPGWRLFHASGADDVSGTWIGRWSLLDLFLLLITAMAVARLYGLRWGALTLVLLALVLPEADPPRWLFLPVLLAEALGRLLPAGRLRSWVFAGRLACLIGLALAAVSFATTQVRSGLYPALEQPDRFIGDQVVREDESEQSVTRKSAYVNDEPNLAADAPEPLSGKAVTFGGGGSAPSSPVASDGDEKEESGAAKPGRRRAAARSEAKEGKADLVEKKKQLADGSMLKLLGNQGPMQQQSQNWLSNNYRQQLDPNNVVQTGPGVPRWGWNRIILRFSGPVQRDQQLQLWLVPPAANLVLALLRVALLTLLMLRLFGFAALLPPPKDRSLPGGPALGAALAALLLLLGAGPARAELPSPELLSELRERLLAPPACHPRCASSSRLVLEVLPRLLRARLEVGAAATTAVPLPGGASQWLPERVLLDGKPAPALLRTEDGKLWLQVGEGSHQILLEGPLPSRDTVQISLPLKPHRVEAKTQGWRLDGLHEDGEADEDLQLSRIEGNQADGPSGLQSGTLPPFVRVERDLSIGLKWEVQTRVVRVTPTGSAVVLEVPLLPGESVTTPEVRVAGQKAQVNMAPGVSELSWHSILQERPELLLTAASGLPWTEVWRIEVGPIWHVDYSGIPVVQPPSGQLERRPEWRPWPGEQIKVALRRPDGVNGSTLTIDHSRLELRPGLRATDATLALGLRASRGGQQVLTLPEGALLESLSIGGESQPLRQDGRKVVLPLTPGAREVVLRWRQPLGISTLFRAPTVELGAASVNSQVVLHVPSNRWALLLGGHGSGPVVGPVVLFWSYIPILLLLAFMLARWQLTPLRASHYLLLGLGLSQVPLESAAIFLGWLLALGWRQRQPVVKRWWLYDLRQLLLVSWTVAALMILVAAIREGLLGHPDMHISGNGYSGGELRFFLDHSKDSLPSVWLLSLPLLCYRAAMLLWALWMAAALLRWLRWAWTCFSTDGMWRPRPPRPPGSKTKGPAKAQERDDRDDGESSTASSPSSASPAAAAPPSSEPPEPTTT